MFVYLKIRVCICTFINIRIGKCLRVHECIKSYLYKWGAIFEGKRAAGVVVNAIGATPVPAYYVVIH